MNENNLAPLEKKTQLNRIKRAIRALLPNASWQAIWELLKYVGVPAVTGTVLTTLWQRIAGVPADLVGVLFLTLLWSVGTFVVYVLARRESRLGPTLAETTLSETPTKADRTLTTTAKPSELLYASPLLLILLVIFGVAYMIKKREVPVQIGPPHLEQVKGRNFANDRVVLDGYAYSDCVFKDVTFVYDGGPASFEHNKIYGSFGITSQNVAVSRTVVLLKGFGTLRADVPVLDPNMMPLEGVEPLKREPLPNPIPSPSRALSF